MTHELIFCGERGFYQYRGHSFEVRNENGNGYYTSRPTDWSYYAIVTGLEATTTCRTSKAAAAAAMRMIDLEMGRV
jgi:hypothetical protein